MFRVVSTGLLVSLALAGCGGGGGGAAGGTDTVTAIGTISSSVATVPFSYSNQSGFTLAVRYLYPVDLDGDGMDELIAAGFETQPNTPERYKNTKITVFGWEAGQFKDLSSRYLPNGANLVEGVGDIAIGDFNGDVKIDIFLSAYSDMDFNVNVYALYNKGGYFEKTLIENIVGWQHGVAAADVNGDGFVDVIASGYGASSKAYLGSASGLVPNALPALSASGSGVAIADFLGDGTQSAFFVDRGWDPDFALMRFVLDGNRKISDLQVVARPPQSLMGEKGHDVRVKAFDFDRDGKMDAIVFTRETWNGSSWPLNSRIQFLKNRGQGVFEDVTATALQGYDVKSNVAYTPVFVDINKDGLPDIFLSDSQWSGDNNSTAILLNKGDGRFAEVARRELSSLADSSGGLGTVLRGPGSKIFFVFDSQVRGGAAAMQVYQFTPK